MRNFFCSALIIILLTSCGFKLRGYHEFPVWLKGVKIENQTSNPQISPLLGSQLVSYGATLSPSISAPYLLVLENEVIQQQISSIAASTTPRQYQFTYTLQFSLLEHGKPLISSKKATITRPFTLNNDRILGSNYEENIIKKEMTRDAIVQLLNTISLIHHDY